MPLYVWMVSSLLVVALIFFVFAQAAVTRSSGQSAADAAALAAAREARDHLFDEFLSAIEDEEDIGDILDGDDFWTEAACEEAAPALAARNDARVIECGRAAEDNGVTVRVETRGTVGESPIPGTEDWRARAEATALIRGRCESTSEEAGRVELSCEEGEDLSFDPDDEGALPDARDLFHIYLAD
ncbi:pilus assembly protein TadG-related protein [Streptomyces sp. DSM 44917]|uniref:Pilus assembly protein TadG-related protein n=1 Tax=Streptomyces boetiae TaxID=3075541 RepID=A0ABU2LFS3_9ACTN|nr:pilus assembly protein TadG-related protein [Streptomyces sp. DSM 44917]MDT0310361.1 pilus assembly protein TadG-related protein [Streptomyces sp. DSM 44917]